MFLKLLISPKTTENPEELVKPLLNFALESLSVVLFVAFSSLALAEINALSLASIAVPALLHAKPRL